MNRLEDALEAAHAERFSLELLETYPAAIQGGSFRNEAIARCALAAARIARHEHEVDVATKAKAFTAQLCHED